ADLAHFKADGSSFSKLVELDGKMYVWSQTYNENLEEYFVYKTYLPEYTVRLDTLHGIIFAATTIMLTLFIGISIYMTINALNPLRQLEHVLDKGNTLPSHKDEYTAYLIQRIMSQLQNDIKMKEALTDQLILIEKTQLRSLRSQINPHLLFNTLNAVSVMISVDMGNQQRAIDMIRWLSEMLRYSLDKEDTVPLATEVMQTRNYLHLLLARYDDDFSVQFHVEAGLEHAATPRLIMQPIIENAVFHGIVPLETRRGVLQIDIHREEPWLCISIKDNGVGMPPETVARLQASLEAVPRELPEKHIGILNVAMRMHLTYPDAPPICVTSVQDEMTCFMLKIPLQKIEHA
ncbi:MAG: histidine kinase, partial [Clostridia bacterium]